MNECSSADSSLFVWMRNNQSLKGAVVATHCQNEAELKFSMEIDHQISLTEEAGKIRLISQSDFPCLLPCLSRKCMKLGTGRHWEKRAKWLSWRVIWKSALSFGPGNRAPFQTSTILALFFSQCGYILQPGSKNVGQFQSIDAHDPFQ